MLYESHTSLGQNGTTRLYQFLKGKGFKKAGKKFVRHCLQCQITNVQTQNYAQLHLEVLQMPVDLISMDFIGPFEVTSRENKYALTELCMLTNYVMYIPLADKSVDAAVSAHLKKTYILDSEEVDKSYLIMGNNLKKNSLSEVMTKLGIKHMYSSPYPKEMDVLKHLQVLGKLFKKIYNQG